jgi:hypothetical protein
MTTHSSLVANSSPVERQGRTPEWPRIARGDGNQPRGRIGKIDWFERELISRVTSCGRPRPFFLIDGGRHLPPVDSRKMLKGAVSGCLTFDTLSRWNHIAEGTSRASWPSRRTLSHPDDARSEAPNSAGSSLMMQKVGLQYSRGDDPQRRCLNRPRPRQL